MPARSTMLTGQYVRTHGVFANGVPLPADAPSVAAVPARRAGYRTALHRQGALRARRSTSTGRWPENRMARDAARPVRIAASSTSSSRCTCPLGRCWHYGTLARRHHPERARGLLPLVRSTGLNDDGRRHRRARGRINPIPREHYHTDWVADRTIAWLDTLDADADWFVWMSFPDPHHPWDPPASEAQRVPLARPRPAAGPSGLATTTIATILAQKPRHWLDWYEGRFDNVEGGPTTFVPAQHDARPGARGQRARRTSRTS